MDTINIFEDTLKTVTVVHVDKELFLNYLFFHEVLLKKYFCNK